MKWIIGLTTVEFPVNCNQDSAKLSLVNVYEASENVRHIERGTICKDAKIKNYPVLKQRQIIRKSA